MIRKRRCRVNRLFSVGKVGAFVDGYRPAVEKRRAGEETVLVVQFRVEPFDAELAASLDDGVGGDSNIKSTIFKMADGEPKKAFTRHDFRLVAMTEEHPPKIVIARMKPPTYSWWTNCDRDEFRRRQVEEFPRMVGSTTNLNIRPITVGGRMVP